MIGCSACTDRSEHEVPDYQVNEREFGEIQSSEFANEGRQRAMFLTSVPQVSDRLISQM